MLSGTSWPGTGSFCLIIFSVFHRYVFIRIIVNDDSFVKYGCILIDRPAQFTFRDGTGPEEWVDRTVSKTLRRLIVVPLITSRYLQPIDAALRR